MALDKKQTDDIMSSLSKLYGKENVTITGTKINVSVDIPKGKDNKAYRKSLMGQIQEMYAHLGAVYTIPAGSGKAGEVKIKGTSIKVNKKIESDTSSGGKKAGLKPSDISPSIVNVWLTPQEIVENVKLYVGKQEFGDDVQKQIFDLLDGTLKSTGNSVAYNSKKILVSPEFFEILTSVKLSVLLRANDRKIRETLGIPDDLDLSKSKIKIYIPKKANFPLIDYYINILSTDRKTEENSLKISVKSKVAGDKVNTVKFKDVFDKEKDVDDWYRNLEQSSKNKQQGQRIIAESAMSGYGKYSGRARASVPLLAVSELIKNERSKITGLISTKFKNMDVSILEKCVNVILPSLTSFQYLDDITKVMEKTNKLTNSDFLKISEMIISNIKMRGGKVPDITIWNLAHLCEKILEQSTMKNSVTNYNFYRIFFDEVLTKRSIAYAVTKKSGNSVVYDFYSKVNYAKEYHDWINLRTKNSANQPNDVIGLEA